MNILQLIASNSFITTNKAIIKIFGLIEANIIGLFASMANFNNKDDGWFYMTYERIEDELNISKHISSKAIEKLIKHGVLIDKKQGVPCRRFFKFQEEALFNSLKLNNLTTGSKDAQPPVVKNFNSLRLNSLTTSSKDIPPLAVKKFNTYNNKDNNKDNNLSSLEEIKKYFSENDYKSDPEDFWNFWESTNWMKGKSKITNRVAQANIWEKNHKERFPEKHKTTLNSTNSASTLTKEPKELTDLRSKAKMLACQINVSAPQHLNFDSLSKTKDGYEITARSKMAAGYVEILDDLNINLKFK